jgi:hypothetical protein
MTTETTARTPPYASYTSFDNFLTHLREHPPMPPRIDKSVMSHLNYGTQQALIVSLRSLGFVDNDNAPTDRLNKLVAGGDKTRSVILFSAIQEAYPYFWNGFDLERATADQFTERIKKEGKVGGSTIDKAISFFIAAATAAGIKLSPHLVKRKQGVRRASGAANASAPASSNRGAKAKRQKSKHKANGHAGEHETPGMVDQLLRKFPDFDPKWDDKLKAKWFEGFERLMNSAGVKPN